MAIILADNKALHPNPLFQQRAHQQRQTVRPLGQRGRVVAADQAAHRHPRRGIEQRQHRIEHLAADVFIINVNALRAGLRQLFGKIRCPMVEADVKAQRLDRIATLLAAAGNPDGAAAFKLSNLPYRCAHRPGGGGDYQCLACLRLSNIQ